VLAGVTCAALVFAIALDVKTGLIFGHEPTPLQVIPPWWAVPGALTFVSLFWFWGWMLTDYFQQRPARHPIVWGWALVIANLLAALVYFFTVWRPRYAAGDT
jgi:hypothetical protein